MSQNGHHVDDAIKNYLEKKTLERLAADREAPDANELYLFIEDKLDGKRLEKVLRFLSQNPEWREIIKEARTLSDASSAVVPDEALKSVKNLFARPSAACPHCGKPFTPFKKPLAKQTAQNFLWLVLAVASFALSFVFKRYFMQFLALSLLFGFKWVIEEKSRKTQILIYKALEPEKPGASEHRLHSRKGSL